MSEALNKYKASFPTEKAKPPTPPTEEPKESLAVERFALFTCFNIFCFSQEMPEPQEKEKEVVYKGDDTASTHRDDRGLS